jgi:GAF domain-containing protein
VTIRPYTGVNFVRTEKSLDDWMDVLNEELPCEQSSVMLQIPGDDHLEVIAHRGFIVAPELHLPIGHGVAGTVAETGEGEIVNDVEVDPRFVSEGHNIVQLLCAPIVNEGDGVVGVVNLSNPLEVDEFEPRHLEQVENFLEDNPINRDEYVREEI